MKVWVDPERCQGHTLCAMAAPRAFELDDLDGHATAVSGRVPIDQEENVSEAAHSCPEQAISLLPDNSPRVAVNQEQSTRTVR